LPDYLPSVGFAGSIKPTLGFTLGSQADIRYEAAKKGWLTDFSNFNQPITEVHNNKLSINSQLSPFKSLIIDINAERSYSENINENYIIDKLFYYSQNSNLYGNYANSIVLIKTAFKNSDIKKDDNFNNFRKYRSIIAKRLYDQNSLNLTQTNNSISNLIKGLNCSTRLIFEYKISGIMFPELSNSSGFSGL